MFIRRFSSGKDTSAAGRRINKRLTKDLDNPPSIIFPTSFPRLSWINLSPWQWEHFWIHSVFQESVMKSWHVSLYCKAVRSTYVSISIVPTTCNKYFLPSKSPDDRLLVNVLLPSLSGAGWATPGIVSIKIPRFRRSSLWLFPQSHVQF